MGVFYGVNCSVSDGGSVCDVGNVQFDFIGGSFNVGLWNVCCLVVERIVILEFIF